MDWTDLALDSDTWRALVSAVMNRGVPKVWGNCLTEGVFASQEGLYYMELVA
jgi:hypothetical protein